MKKIQREKTVTTITDIFVSVDGKEFENETDCRAWENSYRGTLEASWQLIKKVEVCDADFGIPWSSDDHECYVIKPRNLNDITLINAYIQSVTNCNGTLLTTGHIGDVILLNFGYDRDYCDVHSLTDHLSNITKTITDTIAKFDEDEIA